MSCSNFRGQKVTKLLKKLVWNFATPRICQNITKLLEAFLKCKQNKKIWKNLIRESSVYFQ